MSSSIILRAIGPHGPCLVDVHSADGATVGAVVAEIAAVVGTSVQRPSIDRLGDLDPHAGWASVGVVAGDTLRFAPSLAPDPIGPVVVGVVGGADAGRRWPLGIGRFRVGRGADADLPVSDRRVSRVHATVEVGGDGSASILDAGSANGVALDGTRSIAPVDLDRPVEIGATLVARLSRGDERLVAVPEGTRLAVNRPPRRFPEFEAIARSLDVPVNEESTRRFSTAAALGPIGIGAVAAFLWGPAMLLLALMTPVIFIWEHFEDRRRDRGDRARSAARFEQDLESAVAELRANASAELDARRERCPDPATILHWASGRDARVWARRADDPDAFTVRVGWADATAASNVEISDSGDHDLRSEAAEQIDAARVLRAAPTTLDLREVSALGIHGADATAFSVAATVIGQLCALHTPADLVVAAAVRPELEHDLGWLRALPHSTVGVAGLPERRTIAGPGGDLLGAVAEIAQQRLMTDLESSRTVLPHIVVLVDQAVEPPAAHTRPLLEMAAAAGITLVWVAGTRELLPAGCGAVLALEGAGPTTGRLERTGTSRSPGAFIADVPPAGYHAELAAALAPLVDAAGGRGGSDLPRLVGLPSLLGLDALDASSVASRWTDGVGGLAAPLGRSADGPLWFDLRVDGPHALVGGTTGAGKSELLQSWVAAMAALHPPERLTFLLIDYKGGAAFKDCVGLPHTVGFVSDLDPWLARRALVSLGAEIRRREELLAEYGAKDLIEMEALHPEVAPPSLVLVVDEFATLVTELPEFVDGVVSIAQRGRSLGIHLVLATQRPAGAINDNIRANTNLRIALRMNDDDDSTDVVGVADAARLSRGTPGRAIVRSGHAELVPFQSAFAGGHTAGDTASGTTVVRPLTVSMPPVDAVPVDGDSDLRALVDAASDAADLTGRAAPRRPWVEPLAGTAPRVAGERPTAIPIGTMDVPDEQRQRMLDWDLDAEGSLLLIGSSGSGKTNTLLTLAAGSIEAGHHVHAFDFATGALGALAPWPGVGTLAAADDVDHAERLLRWLLAEVARRRRVGWADEARLVVLIDGLGAFRAALEHVEYGRLVDELPGLISDGRALGIHIALTATTRSDIPMPVLSSVGRRLILRLNDLDDYAMLGLAPDLVPQGDRPVGRGIDGEGREVQVFQADPPAARPAGTEPHSVPAFPTAVAPAEVGEARGLDAVPLGIGGPDISPVLLDLRRGCLVSGPSGSGRSSAVGWLVRAAGSIPEVTTSMCADALQLRNAVEREVDGLHVIGIDDLDAISAPDLLERLADIADGMEPDVFVVVGAGSIDTVDADAALSLRRRGTVVLLATTPDMAAAVGIDLPKAALAAPPGRGYVASSAGAQPVQIVHPTNEPAGEVES